MITILSFFTNNGIPAEGLVPTIKIRKVVDNSIVVDDVSMTEVGDGWYKYEADIDETIDYIIVCDGGNPLTTAERYVYGDTEFTNIEEKLELLDDKIELIKQIESGRWKIDTATNQMVFYKEDNITEIMRFNLKNTSGQPSSTIIAERTRA